MDWTGVDYGGQQSIEFSFDYHEITTIVFGLKMQIRRWMISVNYAASKTAVVINFKKNCQTVQN